MSERSVEAMVQKSNEIYDRYANEPTLRQFYTSKQVKRMDKQRNKWRKRFMRMYP